MTRCQLESLIYFILLKRSKANDSYNAFIIDLFNVTFLLRVLFPNQLEFFDSLEAQVLGEGLSKHYHYST